MQTQACPLCNSTSSQFEENTFLICNNCKGIFRPQSQLPTEISEKSRYEDHENNATDVHYQKFVEPITNAIFQNFTQNDTGLDFGSGASSPIKQVLTQKDYNIQQYDPFFHNNTNLLKQTYDYIAACEVIEHFHNPAKEFKLLYKLLKPTGTLLCMTHLYNETIDFKNWYYRRDKTHTFIYQTETINYIQKAFNFQSNKINNRLIIFTKK